jgi:hypothetical protein
MLEPLRRSPHTEAPASSTGYWSRIRSFFDQGALVTNAAGFGIAGLCGFMAWIAGSDPAFIVMLLTFGWLVAIVSVLASELRLGLPIILLTGLAFGFEGAVLNQHSGSAPPPVELKSPELKVYVKEFTARLRQIALPYKSKFDEIDRHFMNTGVPQEKRDSAVRNSDEYKMLLLEETNSFANQYLLQSQLLQHDLLKRLGPKYPEALYPPGDSRHASIEAAQQMLKDGALLGVDPISQVANYLDGLADSLP